MREILGKIERASRPGRAGQGMGDSYSEGAGQTAAQVQAPCVVSWSGTTPTVHRRILLGIPSHGIGAELA
jgi:hypothetical protein